MAQLEKPLFQVSIEKANFVARAQRHLYAQLEPIVETRTGRLIAAEALMRGVMNLDCQTPPELLDVAYECGALMDVELHMAKAAIEAITSSAPLGTRLFLNVDGRTLPNWDRFAYSVEMLLDAADMSPAEVTLEISEANQVLEGNDFENAVSGLQGHGFRIAIDDFGTGISGLRMLYEAQPNFLKVDRFFIQNMPEDAKRRVLVQAVSRLAGTLGAQVIAEGVETREEFLACRWADCELVQGFFLKDRDAPAASLDPSYQVPGSSAEETSIDQRLGQLVQTLAVFPSDVSMRKLFEAYRSGNLGEVIPIVGDNERVAGVILLRKLHPVFGSQYGEALANNPSFNLSIGDLVEDIAHIDTRQDLGSAIDLVADRARDGVLLVEKGAYRGYLSPYDLMQLANSIRFAAASQRNPLTGLTGNHAISSYVAKAMGRNHVKRLFAYVDISDFKPFNDRFGFEKGDKAILGLSEVLQHIQSIAGAFLGHIGGDDFFIAAEGDAVDAMQSLLQSIPDRFREHLKPFVDKTVLDQGSYTGKDREGVSRDIPLIGCTIAGLIYEAGEQSPQPDMLAEALAMTKSRSKACAASVLLEHGPSAECRVSSR